jgi:hypothetical protein
MFLADSGDMHGNLKADLRVPEEYDSERFNMGLIRTIAIDDACVLFKDRAVYHLVVEKLYIS